MARDGNNGARWRALARIGAHWRADGARNFPKGARMFNKSAQVRMARLARNLANSYLTILFLTILLDHQRYFTSFFDKATYLSVFRKHMILKSVSVISYTKIPVLLDYISLVEHKSLSLALFALNIRTV